MSLNKHLEEKLRALSHKKQIRILFVCLGNICRSPAAEGVFRSIVDNSDNPSRFIIDSAGTGDWHIGDLPDRRMRVHAQRRGYNLTHHARQIRPSDFDDFDLIVVMDESNRRNVKALARTVDDVDKIVAMGDFISAYPHYDYIPDPYYEGAEGFELVLDLLEDSTSHLYNLLADR